MAHSVTGLHIYYYFGHLCDYQAWRTVFEKRPPIDDPGLLLLLEQGRRNEAAWVEHLREVHGEVLSLQGGTMEERAERTLAAMRAGAAVLHNGVLDGGPAGQTLATRAAGRGLDLRFRGETDLLIRVDGMQSAFGTWGYRVVDVKSSRTGRLPQFMQVAYYDRLLEGVQGASHGRGSVIVFPDGSGGRAQEEFFDLEPLAPSLTLFLEEHLPELLARKPEEIAYHLAPHCAHCLWNDHCRTRAETERDLSLVPGMQPGHRRAFRRAGIDTLEALAGVTEPVLEAVAREAPSGGDTVRRLHAQALTLRDGAARPRMSLRDAGALWLLERNRVVREPFEANRLAVLVDLAGDAVAGTESAWVVRVGDHPPQKFHAGDAREEELAFARFLDGMARVHERTKGRFTVFHDGGGLDRRLERLFEKYPAEGRGEIVRETIGRMVDMAALLRRSFLFPVTTAAPRDEVELYLQAGGILPEPAPATPLGLATHLAETAGVAPDEGLAELTEAAARIGIRPDALPERLEPFIALRMHAERRHPFWMALVEDLQIRRLARLQTALRLLRMAAPERTEAAHA